MNMRRWIAAALIAAVVLVAAFFPLDMYISRPGGAYDLKPLVEVENTIADERGTFSLMTIAIGKATPVTYMFAKFSDKMKLLPAMQVRRHGESDEEYTIRQRKLMTDSKIHALSVAFEKAGLPAERIFQGIFVAGVVPEGAAAGKLKTGDTIQSINGAEMDSAEQFIGAMKDKRAGEEVTLEVKRGDKTETVAIVLQELQDGSKRAGLGIQFEPQIMLRTKPKADIYTEDIGGPSAGLMFTLELLNRLVDEDLTKGYNIAGTGEMLEDGSVGRIGGIDFKVMAADAAKIEVFFAPDDELPEEVKKKNPQLVSNYEEAKRTAEKIGTSMKIIPVKTIDDALAYLEQLEEK